MMMSEFKKREHFTRFVSAAVIGHILYLAENFRVTRYQAIRYVRERGKDFVTEK